MITPRILRKRACQAAGCHDWTLSDAAAAANPDTGMLINIVCRRCGFIKPPPDPEEDAHDH